ncbi:shikimate dehydrogenase [Clostridium brassicae]|uniref:Shikimate dehydrogenase (NADP(+)) n=1 Tax=Clostridium brassicae TaxID=2999072 RepID=A0ABT4DAA7_9CLOT|nr:shikimate dehydrogenase [Clostridium brassicae]MCY6959242.1 shikimate dehydrogenase [Clostridium brassicae]
MKNLYGLLGEKLSHSFSPEIHSEIFKEIGVDGYYHLFNVGNNNLENAVFGAKALKISGLNVTIPYKVEIMKNLDTISREAEKIGAVNTICFDGEKVEGYNTDYYGFGMMLDKFHINLKNKRAFILGTGGAARAVIQYLIDNEIQEINVVSRNKENSKQKFKEIKIIDYKELENIDRGEIIINSTPCGMYPNVNISPISRSTISKFKVAVDLIYNPKETLFLKYAKEEGVKDVNGLYMLIGQAVKSEELWNNIKIDNRIVDKIYEKINSKIN